MSKEANEKYIEKEHLYFLGKTNKLTPKSKITKKNISVGYAGIKVQLLSPTSSDTYLDWLDAAYAATFETWYEVGKNLVDMNADYDEKEKMLFNILKTRKISAALESAVFTFRITGISRAITHQIVRHRKMAFGQQSLRTADPLHNQFRMPQHVIEKYDVKNMELINKHYYNARLLYHKLVTSGVPREQARYILPMGITTSINAVMPLNALLEYIQARTSAIAQEEHSYLVNEIIKAIDQSAPEGFKDLLKILLPEVK